MKKNDILELTIERMSGASGIAKYDGLTVFVRNALAHERVLARVERVTSHLAFAKALEIREPSPDRVEPPCPYYAVCGGCTMQHMRASFQLSVKASLIQETMQHIGGVTMDPPCVEGMEDPWHYRNKIAMPVGGTAGSVRMGYYAPRSHRVTDVESCLIAKEQTNAALRIVRLWMNKFAIEPYREETRQGLVRHFMCRANRKAETMAVLVATSLHIPHEAELLAMLRANVPDLCSLIVCENRRGDNVILGEKLRTVWGRDTLEDELCGFRYELSPLSFFQVNPVQTEKLYSAALEFADPGPEDLVADLYCGAGTISLLLASRAKRVLGIEYVEAAVENARRNATRNGIKNCEFLAGKTEKILPEQYQKGFRPNIVVLDPPRKGIAPIVAKTILDVLPRRIVYVSCDPATLARDIKLFVEGGYAVHACKGVDMFCQTEHVETVCLMSRKDT